MSEEEREAVFERLVASRGVEFAVSARASCMRSSGGSAGRERAEGRAARGRSRSWTTKRLTPSTSSPPPCRHFAAPPTCPATPRTL